MRLHEIVEQVVGIVRAGRGLGMILHAEDGLAAVAEAFQRLVVQVDVRDFDFVEVERIGIHREAVVVRSDLDLAGDLVQHRVIRAAMAELQLVRLAAERQAEDLVPQADAEDRDPADQLAHLRGLKLERLGIAGAVREEHAVGLQREHVFGRGGRGHHRHAAADVHQPAQDVALDAVVVGDHVEARFGRRRRICSDGEQGITPARSTGSAGVVETRVARSSPAMEGDFALLDELFGIAPRAERTPRMTPRAAQMADQARGYRFRR